MIGILVKDGCFDFVASVTGPADLRLVRSEPDRIRWLTSSLDDDITTLTDGEGEDICLVWLDRHKVTTTPLASLFIMKGEKKYFAMTVNLWPSIVICSYHLRSVESLIPEALSVTNEDDPFHFTVRIVFDLYNPVGGQECLENDPAPYGSILF